MPPSTSSEPPGGEALPSWLPDEATLNRLAGDFFSALPGTGQSAPPGTGGVESGVSAVTPGDVAENAGSLPTTPLPATASPPTTASTPTTTPTPPPPDAALPGAADVPRVAEATGVAPSVPAPSSYGIPAPGTMIPTGSAPVPADAQPTASTTSLPGGTPATSTPASFATTAVGIGGPFTPEIPLLANIAGPELTDHGYFIPRDPMQPIPQEPQGSVPGGAPGGPSTQGLAPAGRHCPTSRTRGGTCCPALKMMMMQSLSMQSCIRAMVVAVTW